MITHASVYPPWDHKAFIRPSINFRFSPINDDAEYQDAARYTKRSWRSARAKTGLEGIPLTELARDQKELVRKVMADVLAPFRKGDAQESMKLIEKNGFDNLHMAFYKGHDVGRDSVWDVW